MVLELKREQILKARPRIHKSRIEFENSNQLPSLRESYYWLHHRKRYIEHIEKEYKGTSFEKDVAFLLNIHVYIPEGFPEHIDASVILPQDRLEKILQPSSLRKHHIDRLEREAYFSRILAQCERAGNPSQKVFDTIINEK